MIYTRSRYQSAPVVYMLDGRSGVTHPAVMRPYAPPTPATTVTRWDYGTRIDIYGSALFADPELWWRVMDGNPEILDPASMVPGTPLRLP